MTDDDRLAELFRAAASEPGAPPPGFDHDDVVATSRRITVRRRSALIGGAFALFAVVGVGAAVAVPESPSTTSAAAPAAGDLASAERAAAPGQAPVPGAVPGAAPEAPEAAGAGGAADARSGGAAADAAAPPLAQSAAPFTGIPLGPGHGACADRQDPQLRAYLEQVLPEVIGAPAAASTEECRPGTHRYLTLEVQDGAAKGLLGVADLPPGPTPALQPGSVAARTASGGTVIVFAGPMGGTVPPPFLNRLDEIAAYLAPRL